MNELQKAIDLWDTTYHSNRSIKDLALKLSEETGEVCKAVRSKKAGGPNGYVHEAAQVIIYAIAIINRAGANANEEVAIALDEKFVQDSKKGSKREH